MKNIKVLGTGCANCKTTIRMIEKAARAKGVEVELEKVEEIEQIMAWGVISTPGVVVDGELVHAGAVPPQALVDSWLEGTGSCCVPGGSAPLSGGCCG